MLADELEKCPHCGGTKGFYYKITTTGKQLRGWNYDYVKDFYIEFENKTKVGVPRCLDCNKIIKETIG